MQRLLKITLSCLLLSGPAIAMAANRSVWNFDGNLATADGAGSLYFLDDGSQSTETQSVFGTTASGAAPLPGLPDLVGGSSGVLKFPGLSGERNGLRLDFNLPDNDGPTVGYLDSYTLVMDLYVADAPADGYLGLFNTNEAHENSAEVWLDFASSSGGFYRQGDGAHGNDTFHLDTWHRIALVVRDSATLDLFVDGVKVADDVSWDDGDSLYTTDSPDPDFGGASFSIFGDSDIYHGEGYVSSLAFYDMALSDATIADLGGATAVGIPEPGSIVLAGIGMLLIAARLRYRQFAG